MIAITIVNARYIFEREGKIPITLPEHRIEATDLGTVLAAAQRPRLIWETWLEQRIDIASLRGHDRRVWETTDPDGRRVVLSTERWLHILESHDELANELEAILDGLSTPALRRAGRWPDEEWFYLAGLGPTRFVKVVVHYERGEGRLVTAFPRRAFP